MTYTQFYGEVQALANFTYLDQFIAEREYQDWMEPYTSEQTAAILSAIWELKDNPVKGIKKVTHLTNKALSERYGIPTRSIENWCCGERQCPAYTWMMMAYCVFTDAGIL